MSDLFFPWLRGDVFLKSELSLEQVAEAISKRIFAGIPFGGKELNIHDEVPAVFINEDILGFEIVLDGYSGYEEGKHFILSIAPAPLKREGKLEDIRMDNFLYSLLKEKLADVPEITVIRAE